MVALHPHVACLHHAGLVGRPIGRLRLCGSLLGAAPSRHFEWHRDVSAVVPQVREGAPRRTRLYRATSRQGIRATGHGGAEGALNLLPNAERVRGYLLLRTAGPPFVVLARGSRTKVPGCPRRSEGCVDASDADHPSPGHENGPGRGRRSYGGPLSAGDAPFVRVRGTDRPEPEPPRDVPEPRLGAGLPRPVLVRF